MRQQYYKCILIKLSVQFSHPLVAATYTDYAMDKRGNKGGVF
jgi:hypothetical protein